MKRRRKGNLQLTLRTAIIKLLRKGNIDPTNPNNFKSISLLSAICKIFSCAIGNRLKKTLPTIRGRQQKAYVPNDNIWTCLLNLLSTMLHCNKNKLNSPILLVDFWKAFDSIDHNFIYETLRILNFGEDIIDMVKLFLTEIIAHVILLSNAFGIRCTTRRHNHTLYFYNSSGNLTDQIVKK